MARTAVLTKKEIQKAAFEIIHENGYEQLSIRSIAKKLNRSTAPIYTQYNSMDALLEDLEIYVKEILLGYTQKKWTPDGFLDIGVGLIAFTLDYPVLYKHYFIDTPINKHSSEIELQFITQMKTQPALSLLSNDALSEILDDMSIFTYGLTNMICADQENSNTLDDYIKKLRRTGNKIIHYHILTSGNYERFIKDTLSKKQ